GVHAHPAGALDYWLHNDRRDFPTLARQDLMQAVRAHGDPLGPEQQRFEAAEEHGVAADGHRPERVAVVPAFEPDEHGALRLAAMAPVLVAHLERNFDGRAA